MKLKILVVLLFFIKLCHSQTCYHQTDGTKVVKLNKYFILKELLPPDMLYQGMDAIHKDLLPVLNTMRECFGPIDLNNYYWGGKITQAVVRNDCTLFGAPKSKHKRGRAADCRFRDYSIREVYDEIVNNKKYWRSVGITRIENTLKLIFTLKLVELILNY